MKAHFFLEFFLILICISVFVIDIKKLRIPNYLNLLILILAIAFAIKISGQSILMILFSIIVVFLSLYFFSTLMYKIKGQVAFGMGDVKFASAITPWVGILNMPWVLLVASICGILWALLNSKDGWKDLRTRRIPFGPFMVIGVFLSKIITWIYSKELYEILIIG